MKAHLAIFSKEVISQIIHGTKTVESRFSKHRISPFGEVDVGDHIYMKVSGGDVVGRFVAKKVIYFENLEEKDWQVIKTAYGKSISWGDSKQLDKFFKEKSQSSYGTLIFIDQVEQFIASPIKIEKKDRRGWVLIDI